ncbi:hypothetical protein Bca52824_066662 [Brassica carinata]|uniref:No apical meristem-associated C-terminal domain-containing protein n=1 Tax=Brassica carinata TaxID=52824 RepID=A0A8X7QL51_BRACI|nr:hypothetical protein Bca52824_066662 [Brassica carinata]
MQVFHMVHHNSLGKLQASIDGSGKKRKYDDGAQSKSSQATSNLGDQPTNRPPSAVTHFQTMCSIKEKDLAVKEKDLAVKERVSKMSLLDSLISKKDSLFEAEEALKQKLLTEMLSN